MRPVPARSVERDLLGALEFFGGDGAGRLQLAELSDLLGGRAARRRRAGAWRGGGGGAASPSPAGTSRGVWGRGATTPMAINVPSSTMPQAVRSACVGPHRMSTRKTAATPAQATPGRALSTGATRRRTAVPAAVGPARIAPATATTP